MSVSDHEGRVAEVCAAFRAGEASRTIAVRLCLPVRTVREVLRRAGLLTSEPPAPRGKKSQQQRAAYLAWLRERKRQDRNCLFCHLPAEPGRSVCQRHREAQVRQRRARVESGKCCDCGKPHEGPGARCPHCRERTRVWGDRRKAERLAMGLCRRCGKEPHADKRDQCEGCLEKGRLHMRRRKEERLAAGLCGYCARHPHLAHAKVCESCYFGAAAAQHFADRTLYPVLAEIFRRQEGRCVYSGLPLTLGLDASVDHRVPVAQGGPTQPDNLQWVHATVNDMKRHLPEAEFLRLVRLIAAHRAV